MNRPSGDHKGLDDTESTKRIAGPPSIGILNTRTPCPSLAATAIHLPSGDHDAAPLTSSDSAIVRGLVPSAVVQWRVDRLRRRTGKHTLRPSGETATAPTTAP